ncbi:hypothetical protein Pmani_035773 [Petrolisthes manimaculis]|uniref:Uncharacterized protein n=1 Tax=Petrolisthes manimaculis TaxID=1843537 RepID=A0AAE1NL10_9EUCA|nr:hypothetical protein Pmani_035773 [Petrolisthes manimaculis]
MERDIYLEKGKRFLEGKEVERIQLAKRGRKGCGGGKRGKWRGGVERLVGRGSRWQPNPRPTPGDTWASQPSEAAGGAAGDGLWKKGRRGSMMEGWPVGGDGRDAPLHSHCCRPDADYRQEGGGGAHSLPSCLLLMVMRLR